jgi:hypothetical protein
MQKQPWKLVRIDMPLCTVGFPGYMRGCVGDYGRQSSTPPFKTTAWRNWQGWNMQDGTWELYLADLLRCTILMTG